MDILEKPELPQEVRDAAARGGFVTWVGAGLSLGLNCPSWSELARKIVKQLCVEEIISHRLERDLLYDLLENGNPRRVLSMAWNLVLSSAKLKQYVTSIFEISAKRNVYDDLVAWGCPFVTTNYDMNIREALKRRSPDRKHSQPSQSLPQPIPNVFWKEDDILETNLRTLDRANTVIHLHGVCEHPSSMIVTTDHYIQAYSADKDTRRRAFLENLFKRHVVLFLGTNVSELEIIEFLGLEQSCREHCMLLGFFTDTVDYAQRVSEYYKSLGIRVVPFSLEARGYNQIKNIVANWSPDILRALAPPSVESGLRLIDRVEL